MESKPFTFRNSIGVFVIAEGSIKEELLSADDAELGRKEQELLSRGIGKASAEQEKQALALLSQKKYFDLLRERDVALTVKAISSAVSADNFIIQSISNIEDLHRATNVLTKRLKEWFGYYLPEVCVEMDDNEAFVSLVLKSSREQLAKKFNVTDSMGGEFSKEDVDAMISLAQEISSLYSLRDNMIGYLESTMRKHCPNLLAVAGATIGAKLLEQAGSLARLVTMPSSTIQVLGAEKALFRHLKTGSRPPKYGFIINHQIVMKAKEKGKAARALADKISIAVRIDYFKGEFIGDKIRQELEVRAL